MQDQINAVSYPAVKAGEGLAQELLKRHLQGAKPKEIKVKMKLTPAKNGSAANQWGGV